MRRLGGDHSSPSATAQKVMHQLRADGLIRTEPGIGSMVADPEHWEPPKP